MTPLLNPDDQALLDEILRGIECPHVSLGTIDGRWSFFYSDPAAGTHDYKITTARSLQDLPLYRWVSSGQKFAKRYYRIYLRSHVSTVTKKDYANPPRLDVVVSQDDVVHHIHMTTPAEMSSFEAFAIMWYRGAPRLESTDVPYEDRMRHSCLWDFYAAVGWDHRRKQYPNPSSSIVWPEPTKHPQTAT